MLARRAPILRALLTAALALGSGPLAAEEASPAAPAAPAPARPAAAPPAARARGAIVVAIGDGAERPARALAHAVYRDAALRPSIDDATARALVGEAPGQSARAAEIAEVRGAAASAGSDAAARRLLASLGADAGAELVVVVGLEGSRPVARALRVATAGYAPLELGATIEGPAGAAQKVTWPGATDALRALLNAAPRSGAPVRPVAARAPQPTSAPRLSPAAASGADQRDAESPSVWRSPWFWGAVGLVAAAGAAVFAIAKANEGEGEVVHLRGRIAP